MGHFFTWEKHGVLCSYTGSLALDDIVAAVTSMHRHADFDQLKFAVHDFQRVTAMESGPVDLSMLVAHTLGASYSNPHIKTAMVATLPELIELGENYASRTRQHIKTFRSLAAARTWLHPHWVSN